MTAAQKLHGALLDRIEALEGKANDHDDRLVKVENKTKSHDGLHKQGKYKIKPITLVHIFVARSDIDEILDRLGKLENSNNMASALADANLGDNSVELILKAIEDMQTKINAETDKKLTNYVKKPDFSDLESLVQSSNRRLHHQEQVAKELQAVQENNYEMIDGNKKRIARLQSDLDALKGKGSALTMVEDKPEPIVISGDGASAEMVEKLQKMI